ncbi:ribosome biogenesis GTP-binding protein YihA/YsxC [Thermoflavimicrobium daqui]|uniref:Probable GTP-binding protein EngB n=1 Tax=Thermoflavimicrobium daqui TaxID=2137476 RepID=A0A364K8R5_9BACL|nr:ribosome biogenesis GTP-binding protein YihA/YsxC [Thermoflavimicrobium daqui]RAL26689.1 YihA family ribosome biogenesis GTP-binding protein [Thermoflavimicrobium daqui]
MKVTQVEFEVSAVKPAQYPDEVLPEIALAGRSNVGKSSLINCLIERKNLARTSSKPGKTQTINFYRINNQMFFADVPGYGFARVSKSIRAAWGKMMEAYFTERKSLKAVIQVVDLRHPPTADDQSMYQFLKYHQLPVVVVATKADKIPKGKWQKYLKVTKETLQIQPKDHLILFSAQTRQGKEELWHLIEEKLELKSPQ